MVIIPTIKLSGVIIISLCHCEREIENLWSGGSWKVQKVYVATL